MLHTLFVCGTFDNFTGKPSKLGKQLFESLSSPSENILINGGHITELYSIFENINTFDRIFWMPTIKVKYYSKIMEWIRDIKPSIIVITVSFSKTTKTIMNQILHYNTDFMIHFRRTEEKLQGRIIDPLQNELYSFTDDLTALMIHLDNITILFQHSSFFTFVHQGDALDIPSKPTFFRLIKKHQKKIKKKTNHLLERNIQGFPSFKDDETQMIYVTKEGTSDGNLTEQDFVAVHHGIPVMYFGDDKPHQSATLTLRFYQYYTDIKYIYHTHEYLKDTDVYCTDKYYSCGKVEPFEEVIQLYPDRKSVNFGINLPGHGCYVFADNLKYFESRTFQAKEEWEQIEVA